MCRLFGFRSVMDSGVHASLVSAENALVHQSQKHPDGWGLAYYLHDAPHIMKSSQAAIDDKLFMKLSGIVQSKTVLAQVRQATIGSNSVTNTHPFQYGKWVFAHNGNIKDFSRHRGPLLRLIDPSLKRFILGDTDSEVIFFIILTEILKGGCLQTIKMDCEELRVYVMKAVKQITDITGEYSKVDGPNTETYLTFVMTNGHAMIAHQGGKPLHYSIHKSNCSEEKTCSYFNKACLSPSKRVNHFLLASDPFHGENIWKPLQVGEVVGVNHQMEFFQSQD